MNTSPCKFYRAGSIDRAALDFNDAEIGELLYIHPGDDGNTMAVVIDARGLFVDTLAAYVKVVGKSTEAKALALLHELERISAEHVPKSSKELFNNDVYKVVKRIFNLK